MTITDVYDVEITILGFGCRQVGLGCRKVSLGCRKVSLGSQTVSFASQKVALWNSKIDRKSPLGQFWCPGSRQK